MFDPMSKDALVAVNFLKKIQLPMGSFIKFDLCPIKIAKMIIPSFYNVKVFDRKERNNQYKHKIDKNQNVSKIKVVKIKEKDNDGFVKTTRKEIIRNKR